jgi:hypothetical protein
VMAGKNSIAIKDPHRQGDTRSVGSVKGGVNVVMCKRRYLLRCHDVTDCCRLVVKPIMVAPHSK